MIFLLIFGPEPPDLVYAAAVVSRFKEGKPSVEGETDALSVKLWALSDNLGKFPTFGHNWVITSTVGCPIDGLKRQWSLDRVPQSFRGKLSLWLFDYNGLCGDFILLIWAFGSLGLLKYFSDTLWVERN